MKIHQILNHLSSNKYKKMGKILRFYVMHAGDDEAEIHVKPWRQWQHHFHAWCDGGIESKEAN